MRDYDREHRDNARRYAYEFDGIVRRYLLRALAPHLRPDRPALELGCYRGEMTAQLLEIFPCVTVIEASGELSAAVRARFGGRVEVVTARFEDAAPPGRYGNAFLVHTLEHLDDPIPVLARIGGWLEPGGKLFVAVPNANALSRQLAVRMGLVEHATAVTPAEAEHGHRRTYTLDVLLAHLRAAGLRVVDHGGVLVKPLANFQFDRALAEGIVDERYLDACQELARIYPDLTASLWAVCASGA